MLSGLRAGSVVLACALLAAVQFQPAAKAAAAAPAAVPADSAAASHLNPATAPAGLGLRLGHARPVRATARRPGRPRPAAARITGSIAVAGQSITGPIRVSAQGRTLLEAPAKGTIALDAPASAVDLTDHQLVLALEYNPAVRDVCTATQSTATLSSISLSARGTETAAATVAEFLAPSVPAILIPVPAHPATDVSAAILAASAAMAHRYPDAALKLVPPSDVDAQAAALPAGSRIITISSIHGAASTTLVTQAGRPALTITGSGEGLRTAARALADAKSALADGSTVTGMTATVPAAAAGPEQTFTGLGA